MDWGLFDKKITLINCVECFIILHLEIDGIQFFKDSVIKIIITGNGDLSCHISELKFEKFISFSHILYKYNITLISVDLFV